MIPRAESITPDILDEGELAIRPVFAGGIGTSSREDAPAGAVYPPSVPITPPAPHADFNSHTGRRDRLPLDHSRAAHRETPMNAEQFSPAAFELHAGDPDAARQLADELEAA